jgi:hypothetical protein
VRHGNRQPGCRRIRGASLPGRESLIRSREAARDKQ